MRSVPLAWFGSGHFRAAEILRDLPDPGVVGGDDDFRQRFGALAALDDMLDEGLPAMRASGLPGNRVEA